MKCVSCGNEIETGVKFCMYCGASQPAEPDVPPVAEEPAAIEDAAPIEAAAPIEDAAPIEAAPPVEPAAPVWEPTPTPEPVPEMPRVERVIFSEPVAPIPPVSPAQPAEPAAPAVPAVDADKPGPKSKWRIMSTWGTIGSLLLMHIPVIGLILTIVWACGGCRKYAKRNLARALLILYIAALLLTVIGALLLRFVFVDYLIAAFEMIFPGWTLIF